MTDKLAQAWVQQVARCQEEELPGYVRDGVLSRREAAGPLLLELLDRPEVMEGWAGVHVVSLVGDLKLEAAIPELIERLLDDPEIGAREALTKIGPAAIPALLEEVDDYPWEILPTLAGCAAGTKDPRVRAVLQKQLAINTELAAIWSVDFGDPSLIPDLRGALERYELAHEVVLLAGQPIIELVAAIESLGGDAGALGRARLSEVEEARRPHRELLRKLMRGEGLEDVESIG